PQLKAKFHAVAADWESGAIAFVASRNRTPVVVLKGVSDVVSPAGSETYGSMQRFEESARGIMARLLELLPEITRAGRGGAPTVWAGAAARHVPSRYRRAAPTARGASPAPRRRRLARRHAPRASR